MVKGRIHSLTPATNHNIQVKQGSARPTQALSQGVLDRNAKLIVPGGNRQARITFFDENANNQAISGYRVVVGSASNYWIPCRVQGSTALSWEQGNVSGCRTVLVRGIAARQGNNDVSTRIPEQHWATDYLKVLVEKGILRGFPDGELKPDLWVTREQFASMIEAANLYWQVPETDRAITFVDVAPDRWSCKAIQRAVRLGFLTGYPDRRFDPTHPIPLEQAMASLVGGLGLIPTQVNTQILARYPDAGSISSWARNAVASALNEGIWLDPNAQTLRPQASATRGEIAALIYCALKFSKNEPPGNRDLKDDPSGGMLQVFDHDSNPSESEEDASDLGVIVAPTSQRVTLVQTDSDANQVIITSLTDRVDIVAQAADQGNFTESNYLTVGQRYTYRREADGRCRGRISLISQDQRQAIVDSEAIQSLYSPQAWPSDNAPPASIDRVLRERLLKRAPVESPANGEEVNGISIWKTTVDLSDPDTLLTVDLGGNAATTTATGYRTERFRAFYDRNPNAALITSGTFFNRTTLEHYGNLIAEGQFLSYKDWEWSAAASDKRGTALWIGEGNRPGMATLYDIADPTTLPWQSAWFYLQAGPRLVKEGRTDQINPSVERFEQRELVDPNIAASRSAIGFSAEGDKLFLVTFRTNVSLKQAADVMKAIGCHDAMNLDGGGYSALSQLGTLRQGGDALLTHALVVYDVNHPAPQAIKTAWDEYQLGIRRPQIPADQGSSTPATGQSFNQRIVAAMKAKGAFSSATGPGGGVNSCVWAVNEVFKAAGIEPFKSERVEKVREELEAGRGIKIDLAEDAQPGDLVIAAKDVHMGICFDPSDPRRQVKSNSSSRKLFDWYCDFDFAADPRPDYYGKPSQVYRLVK